MVYPFCRNPFDSVHLLLYSRPQRVHSLTCEALRCLWGPVAQLVEHGPFKPVVVGSSPTRLTIFNRMVPPPAVPFRHGHHRQSASVVAKLQGGATCDPRDQCANSTQRVSLMTVTLI